MIYYTIHTPESILKGQLVYRMQEHSFDFEVESYTLLQERMGQGGTTSLLIESVQIEVGVTTGFLLFVWGYYPRFTWINDHLSPPLSKMGSIHGQLNPPFEEGVAVPLTPMKSWTTKYDAATGWICIRADTSTKSGVAIEFATNVIAVVEETAFHELWLHPTFE